MFNQKVVFVVVHLSFKK